MLKNIGSVSSATILGIVNKTLTRKEQIIHLIEKLKEYFFLVIL